MLLQIITPLPFVERAVRCKCLAKIWLYVVKLQSTNIWVVGLAQKVWSQWKEFEKEPD